MAIDRSCGLLIDWLVIQGNCHCWPMSSNTLPAGTKSEAFKPLVPVENDPVLLTQQVRASIVSNVLQKASIGLGVGVALSLGLFKRRACDVFKDGLFYSNRTDSANFLLDRLCTWTCHGARKPSSPRIEWPDPSKRHWCRQESKPYRKSLCQRQNGLVNSYHSSI